jgi:hypothetical protein
VALLSVEESQVVGVDALHILLDEVVDLCAAGKENREIAYRKQDTGTALPHDGTP